MTINYRNAKLGDAEKISALFMRRFNVISRKEGEEAFKKESKEDTFIIAEENGKIIGLISWHTNTLPKHELVKIKRIAVMDGPKLEEVGEGLFSAILQDADKFYKSQNLKLRKVYAMVHSNNERLKEFYKQLGFIEETKLKDHYYKGVDEYILSIFLE